MVDKNTKLVDNVFDNSIDYKTIKVTPTAKQLELLLENVAQCHHKGTKDGHIKLVGKTIERYFK